VIADRDPIVAQALEALVPRSDGDLEVLLVHARAEAGRLRAARRRRVIAAAAFAVLALLAGAAIAADRLDLLPFLRTNDRNVATYSIDRSRIYRGASPSVLVCPHVGVTEFRCTTAPPAQAGRRTYDLATHVPAQPELTRRGMLTRLAAAERSGVSRLEAAPQASGSSGSATATTTVGTSP
jgi:hypothetical protein